MMQAFHDATERLHIVCTPHGGKLGATLAALGDQRRHFLAAQSWRPPSTWRKSERSRIEVGTQGPHIITKPVNVIRYRIEPVSSPDELAAQLGEVLGRDVVAQAQPRETWVPTLLRMGFPDGQTWAFEEIYDGVNAHWIGFGVDGTERVAGATSAREVFAAAHGAGA